MKNSPEIIDIKKTYLAISLMLLAILCVDSYMVVIKFLGDDYSIIQLTVFRNVSAVIPLFLLLFFTKEYFTVFKEVDQKFIVLSFIRGICFLAMNVFIFISVVNEVMASGLTKTSGFIFFNTRFKLKSYQIFTKIGCLAGGWII